MSEKEERQNATVTLEQVANLIKEERDYTVGEKTTVVVLILQNGFEVVGTSACVHADKYDHEVGKIYARKRAVDKVWELAGFKLQADLHSAKAIDMLLEEECLS